MTYIHRRVILYNVLSYLEVVRIQILKDENQFSRMTLLVTLWSKAEKRLHSLFGGLNSWLVEEDVRKVQMIGRGIKSILSFL